MYDRDLKKGINTNIEITAFSKHVLPNRWKILKQNLKINLVLNGSFITNISLY